jgi:hypothetical protein
MRKKVRIFFGLAFAIFVILIFFKSNKQNQIISNEVKISPPNSKIENISPEPSDSKVKSETFINSQLNEGSNLYNCEGQAICTLEKGIKIKVGCKFERVIDGSLTQVVPYSNENGSGYIKVSSLSLPKNNELPVVDYFIESQKGYRLINGQKEEIDSNLVSKIGKTQWSYIIIDSRKYEWEELGFLLFNPGDKYYLRMPFSAIYETNGELFFSPNKKYIAQDEGTGMKRGLQIFSFPDLKKISHYIGYVDFIWEDDSYFFFTGIDGTKPNSPVEDDSYHYVAYLDLKSGKEVPVKLCNDLTDYYLEEVSGDYLTLRKYYVNKISDWAIEKVDDSGNVYRGWREDMVKIPNPLTINDY